LIHTYDLLEGRRIDGVINLVLLLHSRKQLDSMLPYVCSVIDRRRCQNVVRTSVKKSSNFFVLTTLYDLFSEQANGTMESNCLTDKSTIFVSLVS